MKKKLFITILTLTFAGILVFSGYQIYKIISEYESGSALTRTLRYMFRRRQIPVHHKIHLSLRKRARTPGPR